MRVLAVLRLSKAADESTSIERQREAVELWARLHGHEVMGESVDSGVSGATDPFTREGLGPWLSDPLKLDEYDIACAWKLDRFGRSVSEFLKLSDHMTAHGKQIATTDGTVDTTSAQGKFFTTLLAAMAEWERDMISMRAASSQAKLRAVGRWHGGRVPFGYRVVSRDGGKYLARDHKNAALAREMVDKRLDGMSQWQLAQWLNSQGARTALQQEWKQATVRGLLNSRNLIGQRVSKGKLVTQADGTPVQYGEPLISFEKFEELQRYESEQLKPKIRTGEPYLLKSIFVCGGCGRLMYRRLPGKGRNYWYYFCSSETARTYCDSRHLVRGDLVDAKVEEGFMLLRGDMPVMEKVFVPGSDNSRELAQVRGNIDRLREEANRGLIEDDDYFSMLESQTARKRELEAIPQQPDRYEYVPTEKTYQEAWKTADTEERRRMLLDLDARVTVYGPESGVSEDIHPHDDQNSTFRLAFGSKGQTLVITSKELPYGFTEATNELLAIFGERAVVYPDDIRRLTDWQNAVSVCDLCDLEASQSCDQHQAALWTLLEEVRERSDLLRPKHNR